MNNEQKYSTFDLTFRDSDGRLGVWYRTFGGTDFLVDPCTLFNSFLDEDYGIYFLVKDAEGKWTDDNRFYVMPSFDGTCFTWRIGSQFVQDSAILHFEWQEYWQKVKNAIVQLYEGMRASKETYYDDKFFMENMSKIYSQLNLVEMLLLPGSRWAADIPVEDFTFICPDNVGTYWNDIPYTIRIGQRQYNRWISDWCNDIDRLRHNLESYVFNKECELAFELDTELTTIELSHFSTIDYTEQIYGGTMFHYKNFTKVVVHPEDVTVRIPLIAFCDTRQVLQQLYEGLLNIGREAVIQLGMNGHKPNWKWGFSPLAFYNKVKSLILEDYIQDRTLDHNEIRPRSNVVSHIFTIQPDYTNVVIEQAGSCTPTSIDSDDILELHDENGEQVICRMHVPGLYKWQQEFDLNSNGANSTMGNIDVATWHNEGMRLATYIRDRLPDDCDLWYGRPFEDEENRGKRPILVYKSK